MKKCKKCLLEKNIEDFYKYRNICKKCFIEGSLPKIKNYQKENKEKINIYKKNNFDKIKEYQKDYNKIYQGENKIKIKEYQKEYNKEYYFNNKEKLMEYNRIYSNTRYKNDFLFKLEKNIRSLIYQSIKSKKYKKNTKTQEILGCSFIDFKLYLESKFSSWMTWENHGKYNGELNYGWDIDHIIPISSIFTEKELLELNHFTNLQPLCSRVNRDIKKDIILWNP
jgi:hypothetical protein